MTDSTGPVRPIRPGDRFAPLRLPLFRGFLLARFCGALAGRMLGVGIAWYVFDATRQEFYSGLVGLVEIIPVFLLALPAGHLSDVRDRRGIVLVVRSLMIVCSVLLAILAGHGAPIALFLATVGLLAAVRTFYSPALDNLLPRVVPRELFVQAVPWLSNAWQTAAIIGPILAGLLIRLTGGAVVVFIADIALAVIAIALFARLPKQAPAVPDETSTWSSIAEGGRFLRENNVLLAAISLDLFAVLLGGAVALLPAFSRNILHVGPDGLGWLTASQSIGALLMSVWLSHRPRIEHAGRALLWAVAGFGAATIVFGVSTSFWLSFLMLATLGALDSVSVVVRSTLLLLRVPDQMRGRVSAFNDIFVGASNELGGFESGLLARFIGPVLAVVLGGAGTIAVAAFTAWRSPELRRLGKL